MSEFRKEQTIRIGPAGWSYPDWNGIVYPAKKSKGFHELEYLSHYFNTVEVNVSFYRPVTSKMAESWVTKVAHNPEFLFTVKLWNRFTHNIHELQPEDSSIFRQGIQPLMESNRLGCVLMQFPWSFKNTNDNQQHLERVIDEFQNIPLVLEVRHASWISENIFNYLHDHSVGFCNIDQPVFYKSIKPTAVGTSLTGYVRLHGRNYEDWFREGAGRDARYDYLYSEQELAEWIERIKFIASQTNQTFVITNNHFRGQAVTNALQINHAISGKVVRVPPELAIQFPELRKIADALPPGQISLF
jgi:uncharacterized protein YecE (DUF72 family)